MVLPPVPAPARIDSTIICGSPEEVDGFPHPVMIVNPRQPMSNTRQQIRRRLTAPITKNEKMQIAVPYSVPALMCCMAVFEEVWIRRSLLPPESKAGENEHSYPTGTPSTQASCTCCWKAAVGTTVRSTGCETAGATSTEFAAIINEKSLAPAGDCSSRSGDTLGANWELPAKLADRR